MPECATCGPACAECDDPYGSYSLVGQSYLNDVSGLSPDCPEGFICGPGGPPWDPPPPPVLDPTCPNPPCPGDGGGGGGGATITLEGCESVIVRSVPAGISEADYNAVLVAMLQERADQQERCDEFPNEPPPQNPGSSFRNDEYCLDCPGGEDMTQITQLPAGLYIANGQLCVGTGTFARSSKAEANLVAAQFVNNWFAALVEDGVASCAPPWDFLSGAGTPGFGCRGEIIAINMQGDPPSRFTGFGGPCNGIEGDYWSAEQFQIFGPYTVEKDVLISGTADYVRGTILCAGGGAAQMQIAATGLTAYSGHYTTTVFSGTASINDAFNITGSLPIGNQFTVYAKGILNIQLTNGTSMDINGTVDIQDA